MRKDNCMGSCARGLSPNKKIKKSCSYSKKKGKENMEAKGESGHLDQTVDEAYFSALIEDVWDNDDDFPADFKYAHALHLQEALMGAVLLSNKNNDSPLHFEDRSIAPDPCTLKLLMEPENAHVIGESSHSFCEICLERKEHESMLQNSDCSHSYCSDCVIKYVGTKLLEGFSVVACPDFDCDVALEADAFKALLSKEMADLWDELLSREAANVGEAVYCPYKDCSAMLIFDETSEDNERIAQAECPLCHRLFCASCSVPWHADLSCQEYQSLDEDEKGADDIAVLQLARRVKWGRCPKCKFYVERTEGCPHISCRCGCQFCYGCGAKWDENHGGCTS